MYISIDYSNTGEKKILIDNQVQHKEDNLDTAYLVTKEKRNNLHLREQKANKSLKKSQFFSSRKLTKVKKKCEFFSSRSSQKSRLWPIPLETLLV